MCIVSHIHIYIYKYIYIYIISHLRLPALPTGMQPRGQHGQLVGGKQCPQRHAHTAQRKPAALGCGRNARLIRPTQKAKE